MCAAGTKPSGCVTGSGPSSFSDPNPKSNPRSGEGRGGEMMLLVLLAILALIAFGVGFVVHWLFIVAVVLAVVWLISLFTGGFGAGARRW
jgi:Flp pilus assembly protein TadB